MDKDEFSRKMIEILKHGALNLAMGIGYRTCLQEIPLLTRCALKQVEKGFYTGQGVDFSFYPEF